MTRMRGCTTSTCISIHFRTVAAALVGSALVATLGGCYSSGRDSHGDFIVGYNMGLISAALWLSPVEIILGLWLLWKSFVTNSKLVQYASVAGFIVCFFGTVVGLSSLKNDYRKEFIKVSDTKVEYHVLVGEAFSYDLNRITEFEIKYSKLGKERVADLIVRFNDGTGGTYRVGHLWESNFDAIVNEIEKRLAAAAKRP